MKNFTIIADPGIDDLVALVFLWKLFPKACNTLLSSFGNAAEDITSVNAIEFISFVANSWKFAHGAKLPMNGVVERPWPDYFHGLDGVWGVHPDINADYVEYLIDYPNNNDVISLSPMTDALQILQEKKPQAVTIMGGAIHTEGNETEFAETNIAFDPDSAAEFFKVCNNVDVKVVPLDVTKKVFWDIKTVSNIPESNYVNSWLKKLLLVWFDKYSHEREKSFHLHDPLAIYLLFNSHEAVWKHSGIRVITEGEQRGRIMLSNDSPICHIALDLNNPSKIAQKIFNTVFY